MTVCLFQSWETRHWRLGRTVPPNTVIDLHFLSLFAHGTHIMEHLVARMASACPKQPVVLVEKQGFAELVMVAVERASFSPRQFLSFQGGLACLPRQFYLWSGTMSYIPFSGLFTQGDYIHTHGDQLCSSRTLIVQCNVQCKVHVVRLSVQCCPHLYCIVVQCGYEMKVMDLQLYCI